MVSRTEFIHATRSRRGGHYQPFAYELRKRSRSTYILVLTLSADSGGNRPRTRTRAAKPPALSQKMIALVVVHRRDRAGAVARTLRADHRRLEAVPARPHADHESLLVTLALSVVVTARAVEHRRAGVP